jgi:hypothetical protein
MTLYQELRDAGFEESYLEQKIGEGWTIEAIHAQAVEDGFFEVGVVGSLEALLPTKPCNMGVGCDEAGVCYADAHGEPNRCGRL